MGKELIFQQMVLGELDIHMHMNEVGPLIISHSKVNSQWGTGVAVSEASNSVSAQIVISGS